MNDRSFDTRLGVILLGSDWSDLLLPAIRLEICQQLHTVSKSFTFLTSEGFVNLLSERVDLIFVFWLMHQVFVAVYRKLFRIQNTGELVYFSKKSKLIHLCSVLFFCLLSIHLNSTYKFYNKVFTLKLEIIYGNL